MGTKIIMLLAYLVTAIINPNCELGYPMVFKPSNQAGDFKFVSFDVNPLDQNQILIGGQSFDTNSIGSTGTTPYATLLLMDVKTDQILFKVAISPTLNVNNQAPIPYEVCEVKYSADSLTAFVATCNSDPSGTFDRGYPQGRIHMVNTFDGTVHQTFSFQDALGTLTTLKYKVVSPQTANYISNYLYFWVEDTTIFGSGSMMVGDGCCIKDAPRLFQVPITTAGLFDTNLNWNQFTLTNTIDANQDQSITSMIPLSNNMFAFSGYDVDSVAGTQHLPFIGILKHDSAAVTTPTKQFFDQQLTVAYLPSQLGYFNGLTQGEYLFGCLKYTINPKQAKFQRLSFPNGVLSPIVTTQIYSYQFPQEYFNLAVFSQSPTFCYFYGQYDGKGMSSFRMVGILTAIDFAQGKMISQEITKLNSLTTLTYQPWFNSAKILSPTLGYSVGFVKTVTSTGSNTQLTSTAPFITQNNYNYNVPFLTSVNIAQQCLTQSSILAPLAISAQSINMASSSKFTLTSQIIPNTSIISQVSTSKPFQSSGSQLQTIDDMSWCIDPTQLWVAPTGTAATTTNPAISYTVGQGDLTISFPARVRNDQSTCIPIQNIFTSSLPESSYTVSQVVTSTQTAVPIVINMQPFSAGTDTTMQFIMTSVVNPVVDLSSTTLTMYGTSWFGHPGFTQTQVINFFATPINLPPNVPAAPVTAISGADVKITWDAPANGGAAIIAYTVAIGQSDGNTFTMATCNVVLITCTTGCTCSVQIATLKAAPYTLPAGASVSAKVLATNANGSSVYSLAGNGAVLPIPLKPSVPAAPTTTISGTSLTISWIPPADGGSAITGYTVAIQKSDGTTYTPYAGCFGTTSSCTIPLSNLQSLPYNLVGGASFFATVIAINAVGSSDASPPGDGSPLPPPLQQVVVPPPADVILPTVLPVVDTTVVVPVVTPLIVTILKSGYYAPNIDAPQFSNVVASTINLKTGDGQSPVQIGTKPENATVTYELNSAIIFCSLKVTENFVYLEIQDPIKVELAGSYSIKIKVVQLNLKTTYPITINVIYGTKDYDAALQKQNTQTLEGPIRRNPELNQPEMSILLIDTQANLVLKFNQNMLLNNSTMDIINQSRIPDNITGLLPYQIIKLSILQASSYQVKEEFKFDWNVTQVDNKTNTISVKLYFKDPILISQETDRDKLKATIMQSQLFVSTLMVESALYQFDVHDIPRQIPQDQQEILDKMSSITQIGVESAIAASVAVNMIFKGPLNLILGMIGSLQIICYLTLINVAFPPNAVVLYSVLQSLALFDILPSEQISEALFVFEPGPAHSATFYEAGFETLTLILNNGTAFYSLIFFIFEYLVLLIFLILTRVYPQQNCPSKVFQWLQKRLIFSSFITYFMQCYSGMHMAAMLNADWMAKDGGVGDNLSLAITYILIIPLNLQAVILLAFLLKNFENFEKPDFKAKYSALYGQLKEGKVYLGYPVMLVLRRQLFNLTCLYCMEYPSIQIIALMYQSKAIIIYIGYFKPQKRGNTLEFFNEAAILFTLYTLMLYTDFVPNPEVRYHVVGTYLALPLAFSHIGVNLGIILVNSIRNFVWEVKKRWYSARNNKIIAAKQKEEMIKKNSVQPLEQEKITNFSFNNLVKDYQPRRARLNRSPRTTNKLVEEPNRSPKTTDKLIENPGSPKGVHSVPEEFKIDLPRPREKANILEQNIFDLPKMHFDNKFNAKRTLVQRSLIASVPYQVLTAAQIETAEKQLRNSRVSSDEVVTRYQQEKTRPNFKSLEINERNYAHKPSNNQRRNGSLESVSHNQGNSLLRFNRKEEVTIERAGMGHLQISLDDWQRIQRGAKINIKRRPRNGVLGSVGSQIALN